MQKRKRMSWKQMKREGYLELYLMMVPVLIILFILVMGYWNTFFA